MQREQEGAAVSTIRRRLAALSSLFKHLVKHGAASRNPVVDVDRPAINRDEGSTAAFSKIQARKIPDAPPAGTLAGLRDRAILPVGLQVGFRRAEIAALDVGDLHENRGFDALRVIRKGGRREALAINPQAAQRIRAYLEHAGHGDQLDAPLFRPLRGNAKPLDAAGRTRPPTRRSTTKFLSDRCLLGAGTLQAWVRPEILPFRDEFFKQ
jgi:site-specific recombinase XerD